MAGAPAMAEQYRWPIRALLAFAAGALALVTMGLFVQHPESGSCNPTSTNGGIREEIPEEELAMGGSYRIDQSDLRLFPRADLPRVSPGPGRFKPAGQRDLS